MKVVAIAYLLTAEALIIKWLRLTSASLHRYRNSRWRSWFRDAIPICAIVYCAINGGTVTQAVKIERETKICKTRNSEYIHVKDCSNGIERLFTSLYRSNFIGAQQFGFRPNEAILARGIGIAALDVDRGRSKVARKFGVIGHRVVKHCEFPSGGDRTCGRLPINFDDGIESDLYSIRFRNCVNYATPNVDIRPQLALFHVDRYFSLLICRVVSGCNRSIGRICQPLGFVSRPSSSTESSHQDDKIQPIKQIMFFALGCVGGACGLYMALFVAPIRGDRWGYAGVAVMAISFFIAAESGSIARHLANVDCRSENIVVHAVIVQEPQFGGIEGQILENKTAN